jgi:hypothetical protein
MLRPYVPDHVAVVEMSTSAALDIARIVVEHRGSGGIPMACPR